MKKVLLLLVAILFTNTFIFSQNGICEDGNCKDGYGDFYNKSTNEIYHGYFKDSKFDGVGLYTNNDGLYYGQFIEGKIDGFTVYYQNGNINAGKFVDGIKEGAHFTRTDKKGTVERKVVTYKKGKEVNTENLKLTPAIFKSGKECLSGNCKDGNGIFLIKSKMVLIIGKFNESVMQEGEYLNLMNGESDYFASPKDTTKPYFKFSKLPMKEGGFLELAAMYIKDKKNGQAMMYQTKSKKMTNSIYKNDEIIE